ncbi:MAG: protein kinase, partial [Planctomycetota bacterium]
VKPIGHHPELSLTDTRALTGTPLYMAPEVIRSAEAAGPASDVYQIGAVGWFMLTGRHVFEGANAVEVLDQHLNVEPKRPSAVLGAEIEPLLEDLMMRCLAKDPAERPADAGELSQALRGLDVKPPFGEAAVAAFWAEWAAATGSSGGVQETDSAPIAVGGSLDIGERLGEAARAPSP